MSPAVPSEPTEREGRPVIDGDQTDTRRGWEPCVGGNAIGFNLGHQNMCRACGARFVAIPDGYVPRHDAPSVEAILEIMMEQEEQP